jgi:hypothetical protein
MWAEEQMDRHEQAKTVAFLNFANEPKSGKPQKLHGTYIFQELFLGIMLRS